MTPTKTIWWDKNNDQHEGWIKDGKTYMDEAATTRVPIGATVQTAAGTYKLTSNGGIPTYATSKNQYEQKSNAAINAYQAAANVQQERIKSATDAAIAEINRQKGMVETNRKDADRAAKEAYLKAANPFGALEEQRVRLGLDESGYAESSKLKLASAYAGQLSENQRAMNEQIRTLDVQIAQARASGDYELANMYEARAQNIMQQQIALQSNLFSGDMQAMGQAESTRQFDEQMAAQKEQAERDNKWNLAMTFIENGKDASFISETLGIPQSDVNTLIAAVNAGKTARSGGVGDLKDSKNTQYLKSLIPIIGTSGLTVSEWIEEHGAAYGITSASDKKELIDLGRDLNANRIPTKKADYQHVLNVIGGMKRRGKGSKEEITAYIDGLPAGTLTVEELDSIIDTFGL